MNCNITPFAFLYILSVTFFVGKIAAFSFLVAPLVHRVLEKDQAAKLLRSFFPRYYRFGILCAAAALISGVLFAYNASLTRVYQWLVLWVIALVAEVFALKFLVPTVEATREARAQGDPVATQKWESAHRLSVRLNVMNLLIGIGLVWLYVA